MKDLTGKGKPFHSSLDKAAALLKRKVGTGAEFMQELKALGGIKQAEIDERKLGEVMGMPRMTHDQFMANLSTRPVPAIREKVLKNPSTDEVNAALEKQLRKNIINEYKDEGYTAKQIEEVLPESLQDALNSPFAKQAWVGHYEKLNKNPTAHDKYTLPGGENYREMLIKAPKGHEGFEGVGVHFRGEPNILASLRLKDRVVPDLEGPHSVKVIGGGGTSTVKHPTREAAESFADVKRQGGYRTEITPMNQKKLLHLEELQSDWHQQGRDRGYKGDFESQEEMIKKRDDLYDARTALVKEALAIEKAGGLAPQELIDRIHGMNDDLRMVEERKDKARNALPDAPFKKNWEEMALKRLIHHAAEHGYHGIVVTPGSEQADRYSLAKHFDNLTYDPKTKRLYSMNDQGNYSFEKHGVEPEELPNLIGKETAEKMMSSPNHHLSNQDLMIGGEGMKGFYDKKVPNILNAIGKKHGVKTQLHGHQVKTNNGMLEPKPEGGYAQTEPETKSVHHFPITEDMRKDILTNGLPLYADGGIIRKAEGGNVQLSVEQMRQQLMNAGKSLPDISQIGANEAPSMPVKSFVVPNNGAQGPMPMGGIDMSPMQPGQQMLPANAMQPNPLMPQQPQPPAGPAPMGGGSNILQMTPQGQKMAALAGSPQGNLPQGPKMAMGGSVPMPVNNHPFQTAGERPMPFMAKDGGSDNAPMNNNYSDNGATDFSIDNIQQLALGGGVQGYKDKGYVHHTDINPNPKAGKRFKSEQLEGLMPEFPVNMDELYNQRASIQLRPWDSTSRNVKVTNVSGHDLTSPLITEGGQGFARDIALNKEGISGASGKEIQGRIQSRANAAHEENIKQGGRGHTYDIIANMDKVAPLFTNMPLHVQMDFLKQANLSPAQLKHIEDRIRGKKVQKKTPFTNLLPLTHPESMKQLTESGALRKAVSEELASKTNQKLLDYNLEDLLAAVTVPEIHAAPAGYAGNTFIANVPHAGLGPKRHSVYDTSGYGEYAGKGAQIPAELYMADTFERVSRELQKQFPKAGASAIRAMTIGALQTRKGNVSQMVNDRVMKNIERFREGVKQGDIQNPNDLYGVLGHFYKKHGGYKKGGVVKEAKVTDNLDTMRLALTRNKKAK